MADIHLFRYSAALGFPQMIDLLDCDVLLPSPDEVDSDGSVLPAGSEERPYLYMSELLKLSILLGRITKVRQLLFVDSFIVYSR